MSGTTSTRWYFSDWLSDPGVRASSLAARGLWKDLLCIAGSNKGRDHGFVVLAGRVPSVQDMARVVGSTELEVSPLLVELEKNGVFSRDKRKAIYCRRMVRAEKNRGNGRLGGNPNWLENKENRESVGGKPKALIPEPVPKKAPKKESSARKAATKPRSDWPPDYAPQFWKHYPVRRNMKPTEKELARLYLAGTIPWITFLGGVTRFATETEGTDDKFITDPYRWVKNERWTDEPRRAGKVRTDSRPGAKRTHGQTIMAAMAEHFAERHGQAGATDTGGGIQNGPDDPSADDGNAASRHRAARPQLKLVAPGNTAIR